MFQYIAHCWVNEKWSASINPKGAFFCEIAGGLAILFDGNSGWPVEQEWWARTPKDYTTQMEEYCPKCGCAVPLKRRISIDGRDDISLGNLKRLEGKSFKVKHNQYVLSDLQKSEELDEMWTYRDHKYRQKIAARYGIYLTIKDDTFHEPHLKKVFDEDRKSIFEQLCEKYGRATL